MRRILNLLKLLRHLLQIRARQLQSIQIPNQASNPLLIQQIQPATRFDVSRQRFDFGFVLFAVRVEVLEAFVRAAGFDFVFFLQVCQLGQYIDEVGRKLTSRIKWSKYASFESFHGLTALCLRNTANLLAAFWMISRS